MHVKLIWFRLHGRKLTLNQSWFSHFVPRSPPRDVEGLPLVTVEAPQNPFSSKINADVMTTFIVNICQVCDAKCSTRKYLWPYENFALSQMSPKLIKNRVFTGQVQSGRSWVKVDGPWGLNWMVQTTETGPSTWTFRFIPRDRPLLVHWPSTLTHDRPLWLKRPSTIVLDRLLWL